MLEQFRAAQGCVKLSRAQFRIQFGFKDFAWVKLPRLQAFPSDEEKSCVAVSRESLLGLRKGFGAAVLFC